VHSGDPNQIVAAAVDAPEPVALSLSEFPLASVGLRRLKRPDESFVVVINVRTLDLRRRFWRAQRNQSAMEID